MPTIFKRELTIKITRGPCCPACGCDTFDDWNHEPGLKSGTGIVSASGSIKCHACGKFFSITHYADGETHSTMNLRVTRRIAA